MRLISETVKLSVSLKNIKALVIVDLITKKFDVVDCSNMNFCRRYISKRCLPQCPIIVAAKDFVFKRRKPKADVRVI